MLERERVAYEVELHANRIALLRSVQKECGPYWDWEKIKFSPPPTQPVISDQNEKNARAALQNFHPNIFDKLFRRVEGKRKNLTDAVNAAIQTDELVYRKELRVYQQQYSEWQEIKDIAERILAGDVEAYREVIQEISPLNEISELGSRLELSFSDTQLIEVTLHVNGEDVIPSVIKTQLSSGKLSEKKMPLGQFYELYQDYVCGCALRVARELFALLPLEVAVVTAITGILSSRTGHLEQQPILSIAIQRKTLETLNLGMMDPSDSFRNFIHQMDFKVTKGFKPVAKLDISLLKLR